MFYLKEENGISRKYRVSFNVQELLDLKREIIEKSSEIIHHDIESTSSPNIRDSFRIRNMIKFPVSATYCKSDAKIYRYIYDEYKFPYLVSLIDRLLCGDVSSLDEIFNINYNRELKSFDERINTASLELDKVSNLDIREKRKKLDELENILIQYSFNKYRTSVFSYYEKVLNLIKFDLIDEYVLGSNKELILR